MKYNPEQCLPLLILSLPPVKTGDYTFTYVSRNTKARPRSALGFVSRDLAVSCFVTYMFVCSHLELIPTGTGLWLAVVFIYCFIFKHPA